MSIFLYFAIEFNGKTELFTIRLSLVGSEMCIRDRHRLARKYTGMNTVADTVKRCN